MKIGIGVPVLYNFEGYKDLKKSILDVEVKHYLQDNSVNNLGVAASWNNIMNQAEVDGIDLLFIVNDDVTFEKGSLKNAIDAWANRPDDCILMTAHTSIAEDKFYRDMADFCCFALNPKEAIENIGYFDSDNFYPAYFEDNDYMWRIKLTQQWAAYLYGGLKVTHEGSKTQFWNGKDNGVVSHEAFRANRSRYVKKWGGEPKSEKFTTPYGKR